MKKNQKKKKEVRNSKGKTSAAPVSRFRRIARWTVIGALALFALLCTGGAWFARHPPTWLAQKRQSLPAFVFAPLMYFGDRTLMLTDALGWTGPRPTSEIVTSFTSSGRRMPRLRKAVAAPCVANTFQERNRSGKVSRGMAANIS